LGDVHVAMEALLYLFGGCAFEKQLQRLPKVVPGLLDTVPLAGNIKLRTQRHIAIAFSFDNGRHLHQMTSAENPCNKAISFKPRMDETGPGQATPKPLYLRAAS